jgi:hypothetical protein
LARTDIGREFGRGEIAGALMTETVTGHFVSRVDQAPHELGIAFGNPAEREKGRPGLLFVEHQ